MNLKFRQSGIKCILLSIPTLISAVLIFWNVQALGLSVWDEYYYTEGAKWFLGLNGGWFQIYEPPGFPMVIALLWRLFGVHDYVAIGASGIFAVLTVLMITIVGMKFFGFEVGFIAPLLLSIMPIFLYYSRFAMTDVPFTFFFSATIVASYLALKSNRFRDILLAGVLLAGCTAIKYNGFMAWIVPAAYLPIIAMKAKDGQRLGEFLTGLKTLFAIAVPLVIASLAWLYVLGAPHGISRHLISRQILHLFSPRIIIAGFLKFKTIVLSSHSGQLGLTLFLGAPFYVQVLATWVSIPILLLAIVGVLSEASRDDPDLFTACWFVVLFLAFSCIPGTFQRATIPLLPPLALTAALGVRRIGYMLRNLLPTKLTLKIPMDALLHSAIVILILALSLTPAIQAVGDTHSGYRQAGIILNSVSDIAPVYSLSQPVVEFYHPVIFANASYTTLPNQGYLIVDYTAYLRGYLTIDELQSLESRGRLRLVASIPADIPLPVYLDDMSFTQTAELNATYTSINIYQITNST